MHKVYIGTSGYNYKHWKGVFYPQGLSEDKWLEYYSKHFQTIEINATFYGNFKKEVFKKWGSQVPSDFIFCLKGPRFITHVKRLKDVERSVDLFFKNAIGLGSKLKIILWQFPKTFKYNEENFGRLKEMLKPIRRAQGGQVQAFGSETQARRHDKKRKIRSAFEFRDNSWFNNNVIELLNIHNSTFVIADSPYSYFTGRITELQKFFYIRFHGSSMLYSSEYSIGELKKWAGKIKKLQRLGDVYCYFNNDASGFAVKNAKEFVQLLG